MPTTKRAKATATVRAKECNYVKPDERWSCGRCTHSNVTLTKSTLRCMHNSILVAKGGICDDFRPMVRRQSMHESMAVVEANRRYDAKIEALQIEVALKE